MDDTAKYLIHADITADGIVERNDVVGAVFGQTEGLLGEDLDLRDLQRTGRVGRIDADVESEAGRSVGTITIATRLDKVETAILAAALETVDQIGPCAATIETGEIEDVRQAKRRAVIERAKELLATAFDEDLLSSAELIEEVRESARVGRITDYGGLPAGPRVDSADAIVVVEGRADVLTLLKYGVKNAVAVEGTNVPEAVADLTRERTVTAFVDGDRGGQLVLRELAQVGEIDYVARAPDGRAVEDLDRHEAQSALREKVPFEVAKASWEPGAGEMIEGSGDEVAGATDHERAASGGDRRGADPDGSPAVEAAVAPQTAADDGPAPTLTEHVEETAGAGTARLLDRELDLVAEVPAGDLLDAIVEADAAPATVVLDGSLTQRVLDAAAQRGVERVVAQETGEFTKQPTGVRVILADDLEPDR